MKQRYRTKARETWLESLRYDEVNKVYRYYIIFEYEGWNEPNKVALIFDEKVNFMKMELFVYAKFDENTIEETRKDHTLFSLNFKDWAEELIKRVIKPIEKDELVILLEKTEIRDHKLEVQFDVNEMRYSYIIDGENPDEDKLMGGLKEVSEYYFIQFYDIPSLKEVEYYVQTHPNIRVKYVSELVQHEKAKKKIKKFERSKSIC